MLISILITVWVISGVIAMGWSFADSQRKYPGQSDEYQNYDASISTLILFTGIAGFGAMLLFRLIEGNSFGWLMPKFRKRSIKSRHNWFVWKNNR